MIQRQKTNNVLLTQLEKQESGNYPLSNKVRRDRYRNQSIYRINNVISFRRGRPKNFFVKYFIESTSHS